MKKAFIWLLSGLFAVLVFVVLFSPRRVRVGGIDWEHLMVPGNTQLCLMESVSWQGETICLRFFSPPVDVDVSYDGYLIIYAWQENSSVIYDVQRKCFLSSREELKAVSPKQASKPRNAADDWASKDLLNIHDSCGVKEHWIERVERDFPREK